MAQTSRKHALIIVDLQEDFLPGGALAVPDGDKVVPVIREVLEENSWDCIVMTQDWHPADHVSFARNHEGRHVLDVIELPSGPSTASKARTEPPSRALTRQRPTSS